MIRDSLVHVARLILANGDILVGLMFVCAAVAKTYFPEEAERFVWWLCDSCPRNALVKVLSAIEWLTGNLLILGIAKPYVVPVSALLLAAFTVILTLAVIGGMKTSCGCLGFSMTARQAVVRNALAIVLLSVSFLLNGRNSRRAL